MTHVLHLKAGITTILKSVFGIPLYTLLIIVGRIREPSHFIFSGPVMLAWVCLGIVVWAFFVHPPETDLRLLYVLFAVLFVFMGWLIHLKATDEQLVIARRH